jgi:hypothetical protein
MRCPSPSSCSNKNDRYIYSIRSQIYCNQSTTAMSSEARQCIDIDRSIRLYCGVDQRETELRLLISDVQQSTNHSRCRIKWKCIVLMRRPRRKHRLVASGSYMVQVIAFVLRRGPRPKMRLLSMLVLIDRAQRDDSIGCLIVNIYYLDLTV